MRQDLRGTGGAVRFASGPLVRIEEWTIALEVARRLWSGEVTVHAFIGELPYDQDPAMVTLLDQRHGAVVLTGKVLLTSRTWVSETATRCTLQGIDSPSLHP